MIPGLGEASRTGPLDHLNVPPGSTPSEPPRARPGPLSRPTPGGSPQARFEGRMGPPGRLRGEPGCSRGEAAPEAPGGANVNGPATRGWRAGGGLERAAARLRGSVRSPVGQLEVAALGGLLPSAPGRRAALACGPWAARLAVRRSGAPSSVERSAGLPLHPPPRALAEPGLPASAGDRRGGRPLAGARPGTGQPEAPGALGKHPPDSGSRNDEGPEPCSSSGPSARWWRAPEWTRRRLTSRCRRKRPRT